MGASSVTGTGPGSVEGKPRQFIDLKHIINNAGQPAYDVENDQIVLRQSLGNIVCTDFTFQEGHEKWDDLRLAGTDLRGGVSAPAFTNFRDGLYLQGFVTNQVDEVHFTIQTPHCWKEGTDISPPYSLDAQRRQPRR